MPRAATTTDVFNAVAEPRRREILDLIAARERPVNELVATLGVAQPLVSKHLSVLLKVGAVSVRRQGPQRFYRLNADALKSISEWLHHIEALWAERMDRLEVVLEEMKDETKGGFEHGGRCSGEVDVSD